MSSHKYRHAHLFDSSLIFAVIFLFLLCRYTIVIAMMVAVKSTRSPMLPTMVESAITDTAR